MEKSLSPDAMMSDIEFARMMGCGSFGAELGRYQDEEGAPVFQFNEDRYRHTLIIGRTGSGKSNHLMRLERDDIRNGAGCLIIASHEEDARYPLACVPEWRLGDVVVVDASNRHFSARMNPLDVDLRDPNAVSKAVDECIALLTVGMSTSMAGPRWRDMLDLGVRTVLDPGFKDERSLASVARLFMDDEFGPESARSCTIGELRKRWQTYAKSTRSSDNGDVVLWFISKMTPFVSDSTLRAFFGAGKSTVNMDDVLEQGKIMVVVVPEETIGREPARHIVNWILMRLKDAMLRRGHRAGMMDNVFGVLGEGAPQPCDAKPFFVYIDEFAKFTSPEFPALLSEARKFNVGITLSTQTLSQLKTTTENGAIDTKLQSVVLDNVGSTICYPVGAADARLMSDQLDVCQGDVLSLQRYQPLARLCMGNNLGEASTLFVPQKPAPDNPELLHLLAVLQVTTRIWEPIDQLGEDVERRIRKEVKARRAA